MPTYGSQINGLRPIKANARYIKPPTSDLDEPIIGPNGFVGNELGTESSGPMTQAKYTGAGVESDGGVSDMGLGEGERETQETARHDPSAAPKAAKQYIDAYMADPEWQKAHAASDDIVEKLAPGIGTVLLDRITRGSYSRSRYAQLEAARLNQAQVEKRYLDMYNLERQQVVDAQNEVEAINRNVKASMEYAKDKQDLEERQSVSRFKPEAAEAAVLQAQANVDHTRAVTEGVRATTPREQFVNVPANTDVRRPDGSLFASGPKRDFSPNSANPPRDYSQITGNSVVSLFESMKSTRDNPDWGMGNAGAVNPYKGKTDEELEQIAVARAARLSGKPAAQPSGTPPPSAGSQYTAPPAGAPPPPAGPPRKRLRLGPNGELIP